MHKDKKYLCNICDETFTQKGYLRTHKDSVHEGKKYPCNICDKHFTEKGHLRRHKDSIHEGIQLKEKRKLTKLVNLSQ